MPDLVDPILGVHRLPTPVPAAGCGRAGGERSVQVAFDLGAESGRAIVGRFDGTRSRSRRRGGSRTGPSGFPTASTGMRSASTPSSARRSARSAPREPTRSEHRYRLVGLRLRPARPRRDAALEPAPSPRRPRRRRWSRPSPACRPPRSTRRPGSSSCRSTRSSSCSRSKARRCDAAETLLLIPDLLGFWLSGERVAEATNASTTQLLDVQTGEWSRPLIERLGIPARLFADVKARAR